MRLTGGRLHGRVVKVPPGIRPTGSQLREALFSIWRERLPDSRFLDLFAGSGAVGLEALSRGAREVVFVEWPRRSAALVEKNCRRLAAGGWRIVAASLPEALPRLQRLPPFDLVFADPPYDFSAFDELLSGIGALLRSGGDAAVEHSTRRELPETVGRLRRTEERRYGESALSFYAVGGSLPPMVEDSKLLTSSEKEGQLLEEDPQVD